MQYVNPEVTPVPARNSFAPFTFKREGFQYERELRAVIARFPDMQGSLDLSQDSPVGIAVPVNLKQLIEAVYVGPDQPSWFFQAVEKSVEAFAPDVEIGRSVLDIDPIY